MKNQFAYSMFLSCTREPTLLKLKLHFTKSLRTTWVTQDQDSLNK